MCLCHTSVSLSGAHSAGLRGGAPEEADALPGAHATHILCSTCEPYHVHKHLSENEARGLTRTRCAGGDLVASRDLNFFIYSLTHGARWGCFPVVPPPGQGPLAGRPSARLRVRPNIHGCWAHFDLERGRIGVWMGERCLRRRCWRRGGAHEPGISGDEPRASKQLKNVQLSFQLSKLVSAGKWRVSLPEAA